MIPFSLTLIWVNERKIVMYHKVIVQAEASLKEADPSDPRDDLDFDLVHASGVATNSEKIEDVAFGVDAINSYRLVRTVEMYQTKESMTEHKRNNTTERTYTYTNGWFEYHIPSDNFNDSSKRSNNPSKPWPYTTSSLEAKCVNLGKFVLSSAQVSRLGTKNI